MKFEKEVTTSLPGKQPVKTRLVIVNDDQACWDQLALRSAIIAAQAKWRQAGEVPAEAELVVSELVGRKGRKPINPVERAKADPAYRRRIIAELMALEQEGDGALEQEGGGEQ